MTRPTGGEEAAQNPRPIKGDGGVGARLRQIRGDQSREDFGAAVGVHRNTVMRYETGERPVDTNYLRLVIEKNPKWNLEWLMTGRGDPHAPEGSGAPGVAQPQAPYAVRLDDQLLAEVMLAVEGALASVRHPISTEKRAALIAEVYDDARMRGGKVSQETVARLVKLATSP